MYAMMHDNKMHVSVMVMGILGKSLCSPVFVKKLPVPSLLGLGEPRFVLGQMFQ
jgi:hypothetical protein